MRFSGDDLLVMVRHEGTFTEVFELDHYPCDQQALTMTLNINVRTSGPVPVELVVGKSIKITMDCIRLCPPAKDYAARCFRLR